MPKGEVGQNIFFSFNSFAICKVECSTKAVRKFDRFDAGAHAIPHPSKAWKGGEDAYFISNNGKVIGVADGVRYLFCQTCSLLFQNVCFLTLLCFHRWEGGLMWALIQGFIQRYLLLWSKEYRPNLIEPFFKL